MRHIIISLILALHPGGHHQPSKALRQARLAVIVAERNMRHAETDTECEKAWTALEAAKVQARRVGVSGGAR